MEAALDSVVVNHLLRKRRGSRSPGTSTRLDAFMRNKLLRVGIDRDQAVVTEWETVAGPEAVRQLMIHWNDLGGVRVVIPIRSLPRIVAQRLRQLGFQDTIDKLLLRIAVQLADRVVVSQDSDFWDPSLQGRRCPVGESRAPVPTLCRMELNVTILSLPQLIRHLQGS